MIPDGVQAIFFDAVGTLIFPDPPAAEIYAEIGRKHGSRHSVDIVQARFIAAFSRQEEMDRQNGYRTSEERERRRWRSIVAEVLDDAADIEACFRELYEHFAKPDAWRVDPDIARVLEELRTKGYRLGLASNYDRRLRNVVAGLPALSKLQHLVISSEVGWRKPAPEFFEAMCREVKLLPENVLYIGDDTENDYEGAIGAGCYSLLLGEELPRVSDLVNRSPSGRG